MSGLAQTKGDGRKPYHHGDLRGALLEAIRALVERDGPDAFRIAEACRMAGVSTAAPYKHFADRDAMLHGVALAGMGRLSEAMERGAASHPPGDPARVVALGEAYVGFAGAEPGVFRLMFGLADDHADDPDLTAAGDAAEALVAQVVGEHMGRDPASDDVRLRAYALWCFVHGHSFLMLDGKTDPMQAAAEAALLGLVGEAIVPSG